MTKKEATIIVKKNIVEILLGAEKPLFWDEIYIELSKIYPNHAGPHGIFVWWYSHGLVSLIKEGYIKEFFNDKNLKVYELTNPLFLPCRIADG